MAFIRCPECSKNLRIADSSIGKKVRCACGHVFVAPAQASAILPEIVPEKVIIDCPQCDAKLKVATTSQGKKMKCPKCDSVFVVTYEQIAHATPATKMPKVTAKPGSSEHGRESPAIKQKSRITSEDDENSDSVIMAQMDEDFEDEDSAGEGPRKTDAQAAPAYPRRALVNVLVFFLLILYVAFFLVVYLEIDLGLGLKLKTKL